MSYYCESPLLKYQYRYEYCTLEALTGPDRALFTKYVYNVISLFTFENLLTALVTSWFQEQTLVFLKKPKTYVTILVKYKYTLLYLTQHYSAQPYVEL